jgi:AraC-like DNA-binding protein
MPPSEVATAMQSSTGLRTSLRPVSEVSLPAAPHFTDEQRADLSPSRRAVLSAPEFVSAHFAEKFAAASIAGHCGLSRFQFSRSFHSVYGITFREYLLRFRIIQACARLRGSDQPVTEIAYSVGFHDGSYFARMFRRYTGVLPSQYAALSAGQSGA